MKDYYSILGIGKSATESEIKRAYRKLASQHHPDRGGDANKFKEVQEAYDILSNPNKRLQYDNPQTQFNFRQADGNFDFDTIFEMFGQRMDPRQQMRNSRVTLWVSLEDAVLGGKKLISLNSAYHGPVEITVPTGIHDGENVRYPNLAPGGMDLVVNYRVHGHPVWQRDGLDLLCEKELDFWQLILGTEIVIRSISGKEISLKIPSKTKPGSMLRLKGQGIARSGHNTGDVFVKIKATLPTNISEEVVDFLSKHTTNK